MTKKKSKEFFLRKHICGANVYQPIGIDIKLNILQRLAKGDKIRRVSRDLNMPRISVFLIKKASKKVIQLARNAFLQQKNIIEKIELLLGIWLEELRIRPDNPIKASLVQKKAQSLYEDLKNSDVYSKNNNNPLPQSAFYGVPFHASTEWLLKFKERYNFKSIVFNTETVESDYNLLNDYRTRFKSLILQGQYTPQQVFTVDEIGLFWKKVPIIPTEERWAPGRKFAKRRITLLLGSNAAGDCKLQPLLIHTSEHPRVLRNTNKTKLPVIWKSSKKSWPTADTFKEWFNEYFIPSVEDYCKKKQIPFNILLVLDTSPAHPNYLCDVSSNVRVEFLPRNITSEIQPMDQGVTAYFKKYYLRRTLKDMIKVIEAGETIGEFWRKYNIRNAIDIITKSWMDVLRGTLKSAWHNLWPEVHPEATKAFKDSNTDFVIKEILSLASDAGISVIDEEGIVQFVESRDFELSNADLIDMLKFIEEEKKRPPMSEFVTNWFVIHEQMVNEMMRCDPDRPRATECATILNDALEPYKQMYQETHQSLQLPVPQYVFRRPN